MILVCEQWDNHLFYIFQALQCTVCGKTSSNRTNLHRHMLVHQGKYSYTCQYCGKGFGARARMLEHLTLHTNEYYFPCSDCGEKFKTYHALKQHQRNVHNHT